MQKEILHKNQKIQITCDWITLKKDKKDCAKIFYTLYQGSGEKRPVVFHFNGGPGAASVFLHLGGTSPYRVKYLGNGHVPKDIELIENEHSWIDKADLVYVDPIGTGWSEVINEKSTDEENKKDQDKSDPNEFYKVNRDLESLSEFVSLFLSQHKLWSRPQYICGESYGGYRVAKLSKMLQEKYYINLSGVIMVSPALEFNSLSYNDYDLIYWLVSMPAYIMTAHYHRRGYFSDNQCSIDEAMKIAEDFCHQHYLQYLAMGDMMEADKRAEVESKIAELTGFKLDLIKKSAGRIPLEKYMTQFLEDKNQLAGLYDGSVTSHNPFPDRSEFQYFPEHTLHSSMRLFGTAMNMLLTETLGIDHSERYEVINIKANEAWKIDEKKHALELKIGSTDDLRFAIALNPHMKVLLVHGLYDIVTPYYSSKQLVANMKLTAQQKEQIKVANYQGGHMFYSWAESRAKFKQDFESLL